MAAVPRFIGSSEAPWPVSPGPSRPAAAILRFPRPQTRACGLTPVAPDPDEGIERAVACHEIEASWLIVLALAAVGFVLF